MARADLTITLPPAVWIGALSRAHPEARFRVLAALRDDEGGVALLDLRAGTVDQVVAAMADEPAVDEVQVLGRAHEQALLQFETTAPLLLTAMEAAGVPLELPIEIVDGEATASLTAPRDQLSGLVEELEARGLTVTVEAIRRTGAAESLLTDRQRRVLRAAVEEGYYDTPRTCSLTDLAEELDVAKSTCSETLHRAEGTVVKEFIADGG